MDIMRNILIIVCFVVLGVAGGFLCRTYYRDAIETKLVRETKQQLSEMDQTNVQVKCDHMFAKLKFEPSFALVEQKQIASKVNSRGVYMGIPAAPVNAEPPVQEVAEAKLNDEPAVAKSKVEAPPAPLIVKQVEKAPEPKPEVKLVPELFVYLNMENQMVLEGRFPVGSDKNLLISRLEEVYTDNKVIDMISIASNVDALTWDRPDELILNLIGLTQKGAVCLLYTSPSPRDQRGSRMPSSA